MRPSKLGKNKKLSDAGRARLLKRLEEDEDASKRIKEFDQRHRPSA